VLFLLNSSTIDSEHKTCIDMNLDGSLSMNDFNCSVPYCILLMFFDGFNRAIHLVPVVDIVV